MTKASDQDQVVGILLATGFLPDGQTREETVRVPTSASPVYGRSGGELRTFGGRDRYFLPGTDIRCTVGLRTVNLYRRSFGKTEFLANLRTKDAVSELPTLLETMGIQCNR